MAAHLRLLAIVGLGLVTTSGLSQPLLPLKPVAPLKAVEISTRLEQMHPERGDGYVRSLGQNRAILLLHGVKPQPLVKEKVFEAAFHSWQLPESVLVKTLAKEADVFAFAYSQNTRLEKIAEHPSLRLAVDRIRSLGYRDVVLVGHSAGGVMARLFVEDHPKSGITKVLQVCSPNDGSFLANATFGVRKEQEDFLLSLTQKERLKCGVLRADKKVPADVQFLCVVAAAGSLGDGVVSCHSQWPTDLQRQGIPATRLTAAHFTVFRLPKTAERIAELVTENHPRWTEEKVKAMQKAILGVPIKS